MNLTNDELERLMAACLIWSNYIETRNVALSAQDLIQQKRHKEIPYLDQGQRVLVHELKDLHEKLSRFYNERQKKKSQPPPRRRRPQSSPDG